MRIVSWQTEVSLDSRTGQGIPDYAFRFHGDGSISLAAASRLELTPVIKPHEAPDTQMKIRVGFFVMETCPADRRLPAIRTKAGGRGFFIRREKRHDVLPSYFDEP